MSKKQPKNRSARQKRLAREHAAREARHAVQHPLQALNLPYHGYQEWIRVPDGVTGQIPDDVSGDARALHAIVVRLAPVYGGQMPMAAVYLEQQIQRGSVLLGTAGGGVSAVPVPDMATVYAETARLFPAGPQPGPDEEDADTGKLLHALHALGALVVDDDHVIRLAALV